MMTHEFILQPGLWIGEGKVSFSISSEILHFYTKWTVGKRISNSIECNQVVEIEGNDPSMKNLFIFKEITIDMFVVNLENDILGSVTGTGVIDAKYIAWEFHANEGLEGFEIYELQENGDYHLHAEYTSSDQFRTLIDGRIWKKT